MRYVIKYPRIIARIVDYRIKTRRNRAAGTLCKLRKSVPSSKYRFISKQRRIRTEFARSAIFRVCI